MPHDILNWFLMGFFFGSGFFLANWILAKLLH